MPEFPAPEFRVPSVSGVVWRAALRPACTSLALPQKLHRRPGVVGMASVIWIAFAGLFLVAAITDGRTYRIPNWISLALTALFIVAMVASGKPVIGYWPHAALAAGMLALGYGLYAFT